MLILRNQTKELFDKAGLGEFTIGRNSSGYLAIVGPCSKPIVSITNFSVGTKLSKAERDITINDYLIPALAAHSKIILNMIKLKQEKEDAEKAVLDFAQTIREKDNLIVSHNFNYNDKSIYDVSLSTWRELKDSKIKVSMEQHGGERKDKVIIEAKDTTSTKALVKDADKMILTLNKLSALKETHSKSILDFDKAEQSMIKECAL